MPTSKSATLLITLALTLLSIEPALAQAPPSEANFGSPLDIPLFLTGNFAEIRNNHFHTGIDIKTEGVEGKNVLAAQDGYVSRIAVSAYGYGKALYITHPNGYTTVYAHLREFNFSIQNYTNNVLYDNKNCEMNIFPQAGILKVTKGEIIAESGNSGGSGGPHLHFEIRRTDNEHPVNPLKFGFDIKDDIKPTMYGLMVYAMDDTSHVNGTTQISYALGGTHGNYTLKPGNTLRAHGKIGLAIHTIDRLNGFQNKCGIYTISLQADGKLVYKLEMDELDFDVNRNMNSHVDYKLLKYGNKSYHKLFVEPNNRLPIYKTRVNEGVLYYNDTKVHPINITVSDTYGNSSEFNFEIKGDLEATSALPKKGALIYYNQPYTYTNDFCSVNIPAYVMYRNNYIEFNEAPCVNSKVLSKAIRIGDTDIPLQSNISIKFDTTGLKMTKEQYAQCYMGTINGNYINGFDAITKEGKFLVGKTRVYGTYALAYDNSEPEIRGINYQNGGNYYDGKTLKFILKDVQTGISTYNVYFNDKWTLAYYDAKYKVLNVKIDKQKLGAGQQNIKIEATNGVGTKNVYTTKINIL